MSQHAVELDPIRLEIIANGLRSIAEGVADYNLLSLEFVSPTADIREGDELVSSGLGGLYPVGYPVGTVIRIASVPGESFLKIDVDPSAEIDRSRHLLLVFNSRDSAADAAE